VVTDDIERHAGNDCDFPRYRVRREIKHRLTDDDAFYLADVDCLEFEKVGSSAFELVPYVLALMQLQLASVAGLAEYLRKRNGIDATDLHGWFGKHWLFQVRVKRVTTRRKCRTMALTSSLVNNKVLNAQLGLNKTLRVFQ